MSDKKIIYLDDAIDEIRKCRFVVDAIEKIRGLPSAQPEPSDAVYRLYKRAYEAGQRNAQPEIIYCRDCRWFGDGGCAVLIVDDSDKPTDDDYCSFAERRTDE